MKPSDLISMLNIAIDARIPTHIWGASGVGKSQIVQAIAKERKIGFIDLRAVQLDPVDLRGLPSINNGITTWNTPEFLPREGEGILFLDELTSAPQMVQAACYQLVLDRALGVYRLRCRWNVGQPPKSGKSLPPSCDAAACRTRVFRAMSNSQHIPECTQPNVEPWEPLWGISTCASSPADMQEV